jgi:AcrR family transcriptional regulator
LPSTSSRPLRADARLNHDRVLEAAAAAFARDGADTSLKAIARDAGVGIGTLYRRFPSREALIEATYRNESTRLSSAATELLDQHAPINALREWMDLFVDYMATKHGMAEALHAVLVNDGDLRMRTRDLLTDALASIILAGIANESVRPDVDPYDVLLSIGGITLIAGGPDQRQVAGRLLDLLLDGLRYRLTT